MVQLRQWVSKLLKYNTPTRQATEWPVSIELSLVCICQSFFGVEFNQSYVAENVPVEAKSFTFGVGTKWRVRYDVFANEWNVVTCVRNAMLDDGIC